MGTDPQIAFVLARSEHSARITAALRGAGYRVVDPEELDAVEGLSRQADDAAEVVARDMPAMLECDLIVMGPGCELLPWAVALVATATTMKKDCHMIERVVPSWNAAWNGPKITIIPAEAANEGNPA